MEKESTCILQRACLFLLHSQSEQLLIKYNLNNNYERTVGESGMLCVLHYFLFTIQEQMPTQHQYDLEFTLYSLILHYTENQAQDTLIDSLLEKVSFPFAFAWLTSAGKETSR